VAAKLISRPFRSAKAPERCASIDRCCTPAAAKMVENLARPPQLLDKAEAAKLLRISTRKVENHILRGELGSVRLGRKVFTTEPLIAEFIERNTQRPCPDQSETVPSNTVAIGSAMLPGRQTGTSSGMKAQESDVELRSALATFRRQKNGSSGGFTSLATSSPKTLAW
jgi:excisionase family DNA binding protein